MRRRAIYILAAAILSPILEKAGVECDQHGFGTAAGWLVLATGIVKLTLLVLLLVLLIRVSRTIRRIGFDNMQLYPEHNVVQFQIYDFIGWDNGSRYVYYFSPTGTLAEGFTYTQQLNANWYFARKPRFSD